MMTLPDQLVIEDAIYLVVGATNNKEKYGAKVFADLKEAGYKVIAINNRANEEVQGTPVYPSINIFFERVVELFDEKRKHDAIAKTIVVFVVPPQEALRVLREMTAHHINTAWFQPGSESEEALTYCEKNNITAVHNACIMVERRKS